MSDNERMNDETLETAQQENQNQEPRTFTQEEVDEIVRKRLARERKKTDANNDQESGSDREKTLEDRELKVMAREKLLDAGMPSSLADVLRYSDEKSLEKAMETIKNLDRGVPKSWGERQSSRRNSNVDIYRKAMGLDRR